MTSKTPLLSSAGPPGLMDARTTSRYNAQQRGDVCDVEAATTPWSVAKVTEPGEARMWRACWRRWKPGQRNAPGGESAVCRGPVEVLRGPGAVAAWIDRHICEFADSRRVATVHEQVSVYTTDAQARTRLWYAHQEAARRGDAIRTTVPGVNGTRYEFLVAPVSHACRDLGG